MAGRLLPVMFRVFRLLMKVLIFLAIVFGFSPVDSSLYLCVGDVGVEEFIFSARLNVKLVVCRNLGFWNRNEEERDCEVGEDGSVGGTTGELADSRLRERSGEGKRLSRWFDDLLGAGASIGG